MIIVYITLMKHSYKTTLDAVYSHMPSDTLAQRIESRIALLEAEKVRRKAYGFGVLAIVALAALVPAVQYAFGQTAQSGFYEYIVLFVSDSGYVFAHLREVIMTIAESMPLTGITFTLAALLVTTYAMGKSTSYIRSVRQYPALLSI